MTLLCLVLCACGMAAAHALQSATSTVPERAALLSLVKQVASPAALFQTSKDDCRRVSEACEALERAAALDRPGFPRDLMLVDGRWRCIYTSAGVSVVPTPVLKLVGASPLGGLMPTRVEQRVDVMGRRVVNCVDLCPWPSGPLGNVRPRPVFTPLAPTPPSTAAPNGSGVSKSRSFATSGSTPPAPRGGLPGRLVAEGGGS
jgi:hypothetical protein